MVLDGEGGGGTRFTAYLWAAERQAKLLRGDGEREREASKQLDGRSGEIVRLEVGGGKVRLVAGREEAAAENAAGAARLSSDDAFGLAGTSPEALARYDGALGALLAGERAVQSPATSVGLDPGALGDPVGDLALGIAAALDPADAGARRDWLGLKQVIEGGWEKEKTFTFETPHFKVATNISAAKAREVGDLLERARGAYVEALGEKADGVAPGAARGAAGRPARARAKATCLVFDTDEGFRNYAAVALGEIGRHEEALGFYSPLYRQLLFFEDKDDPTGTALKRVVVHEGFHRFADETMRGSPPWLNEGLAEVFAGEATAPGGVLGARLATLRDAVRRGLAPSVASLLLAPHRRFMADAGVSYAAAWSLCRYLLREAPPASEAGRAFHAYLAALRAGSPPIAALRETLLKLDLEALDRTWKARVASGS